MDFLSKHATDAAGVTKELAMDEIDVEKARFQRAKTQRQKEYDDKLIQLKQSLANEQAEYDRALRDLGIQFKDEWDNIAQYVNTKGTPEIVAAVRQLVTLANAELAKVNMTLLTQVGGVPGATLASKTAPAAVAPTTGLGTASSSLVELSKKLAMEPKTPAPTGTRDLTYELGTPRPGMLPLSYQTGGLIRDTGMYMLHAGEKVVSSHRAKEGGGASFAVNFYGQMNFSNPGDEGNLVEKIRSVLMRDYENAQRNVA
jgi:hypothetical protein